ncbi:MAG: glycosyltransferase, partial [Slackia sp.]|nr:glycosyltransferase [Slackia sp.]
RPVYDITWRYTLTGRLLWGGGTAWSHVMFPALTDYVEKRKPALVICTHITAANAIVGARMLSGQRFPVVCVPTDYEIEGWWPHKETDLFCVATEAMAETLRPRKVAERKMKITGIPVRGGLGDAFDVAEIRESLGLPLDKTIVLIMAGAHLPQPYVRFRATMDEALPYMNGLPKMHFVFLPGRDEEYSLHLCRQQEAMSIENMTVMGYVDKMPALMAASDLAICKSGGLTVTECLCARLPMVLLGRSYGQEKANTRMLTSLGVGMHVTTARELLGALRHLHANPSSLKAMLVNGEILRRPDAAYDIAASSLDLMGSIPEPKKHFAQFYWGGKPAHTR